MAHYKTNTLNPKELRLAKPLASYKVILSDLDHTLIDQEIAHAAAIDALAQQFSPLDAEGISNLYAVLLDGHRREANEEWSNKGMHEAILRELAAVQQDAQGEYGLRKWSREMWFFLAAKKQGFPVTKQIIEDARETYWRTFAAHSQVADDAKQLLAEIDVMGTPLILFTGSDSVMRVSDTLQFTYDPAFSEQYKMKRITALPIQYTEVMIADPYDKPSPKYYDPVFVKAKELGGGCNFNDMLVIGDSPNADIAYPSSVGCDTILIARE